MRDPMTHPRPTARAVVLVFVRRVRAVPVPVAMVVVVPVVMPVPVVMLVLGSVRAWTCVVGGRVVAVVVWRVLVWLLWHGVTPFGNGFGRRRAGPSGR
jgi:hypothetical protein